MEITNLNKSVVEIFQSKYIVPLYQRNYAWKEDEIELLLQDLYENFKKAEAVRLGNGKYRLNYFIGSLVVLKRKDGFYEVIDGQQRLTTLSILLKVLDLSNEPKLFYESRPEVEAFFDSYYRNGNTDDVTFNYKVSHLVNAVDLLKQSVINPEEGKEKRLFDIDNLDGFKKFIVENVILVRVEIPHDTDVAAYFEIMNNRGEQLQKHEILKSYLMERLKDDDGNYFLKQQNEFSKIWDACSQMDNHIQKLFSTEDRRKYFGERYELINEVNFVDSVTTELTGFTIDEALNLKEGKVENLNINDIDDSGKDQSILDFSNFLMHVFKIKYKTYLDNGRETEIPLNEQYLISVYSGLENRIDPRDFINDLLYYRTVFDKFIVKASEDEKQEDNYRWTLKKPYKYEYSKTEDKLVSSLKYENFSKEQERLVKSISLLQVTFRNRKYKNWLQFVLGYFSLKENFGISKDTYQQVIDNVIVNYFDNQVTSLSYDQGVKVPHFLFNFIDYLYWVKSPTTFNFNFSYRNSVEHHLPQSYKSEINESLLDNLGNLCLVSKSSNSKMNNEHPVGKAKPDGKYFKDGNLPPKQKVIYDVTNRGNKWGNEEILDHKKNVENLLNDRVEILSILY